MPAETKNSPEPDETTMCPLRYTLDVFGGKWKLPIICMLSAGVPARYSTIKRKLGNITNVMLSQSLKELEAAGVLHREQYNEVPPRVEYTLTEKGKGILPALEIMGQWAVGNMQSERSCDAYCEKCQAIV